MFNVLKLLSGEIHAVCLSDAIATVGRETMCLCLPAGTNIVKQIIDAVSAGRKGG
jgi:hypothetical protein